MSPKQQSVYDYLKFNGIRGGSYRTPLYVLYFEYMQYLHKMKKNRYTVSPIEFGRRMSVYFEKGKSGRYAYYLTNSEPPNRKRRRQMRLWYGRQWSKMRNGQEEKK